MPHVLPCRAREVAVHSHEHRPAELDKEDAQGMSTSTYIL